MMTKYEDTSKRNDLEIFSVIRDLKKYLTSTSMAMKAVPNSRGNSSVAGYANNKMAALNCTNPKFLEHRKKGTLVICKMQPEGMHAWLTCLDNDDQTTGHPKRKQMPGDTKHVKKQGSGAKRKKLAIRRSTCRKNKMRLNYEGINVCVQCFTKIFGGSFLRH